VKEQSTRTGEKLSLASLTHAEQQVVAGTKYRMTLQVKAGGEIRLAQAVVYQSLAPKQVLTSWQWMNE